MAQACCEGTDLVETPRQWVGLNAVDAVCRGADLEGFYLTADLRRAAVRDGKSVGEKYGKDRRYRRVLKFSPMPWMNPAPHAQQAWFRRIEKKVIAEARARRLGLGRRFPNPEAHRALDPNTVAKTFRPSPAPDCHSSCPQLRAEFRKGWRHFCEMWGDAMKRFKRGLTVCFPTGGWRAFGCTMVLPAIQLE